MKSNETAVIAAFADEAAAESAIEMLREWDKRVGEVKLGNIATVRMLNGEIKTDVVSSSLLNRSVPISNDAVRVLAQELGVSVAVVVACDDYEAGMVADTLARAGGRILANTAIFSKEEVARQEQTVAKALEDEAIKDGVEKVKRDAISDVKRPV